MRLQTRAPAKINVCLLLGPTRPQDGRHELVTLMQSVTLADRVVLTIADADERGSDAVLCPGVEAEPNIAARAVALFRERTGWDGPPVQIAIDKRIPVAGGMAGGSADAGAVLRLLQRASGRASSEELEQLALELGADVPAQVRPGRVLATGAGERLERVPGVARYGIVAVPSARGLATADVFREADRLGIVRDSGSLAAGLAQIRAGLPDLADELCVNELEPAALSLRPELAGTFEALREHGADVVLLSGSGPTVLGLFHDPGVGADAAAALPGAVFCKPIGPHAGEVT